MGLTKDYWYGKEIEGRLYGIDTLFVADDVDISKVHGDFNHVLLGPTLIDKLNNDAAKHLDWTGIECQMDEGKIITLEVKPGQLKNVPQSIKLKAHILLWIDAADLAEMKESDSIKVCSQLHDMRVFTIFNGQKVTRNDYIHDRYDK